MGCGGNLFDVIIAHFVAIFISIKRKILEIFVLGSHQAPVLEVGRYAVLNFTLWFFPKNGIRDSPKMYINFIGIESKNFDFLF